MKIKIIISFCLIGFVIFASYQKANNQNIPSVCLFFDDGWANQYEEVLPVLLEYDFKAAFGIITGSVGTGENFWKYMGEEELKELSGHGMEIACHTQTHPHLTDNLKDGELQAEIIDTKLYLEEMGFEVVTFIYPFYEWDERVIEYVKAAGYDYARGGWPEEGPFRLPLPDDEVRYHLPSIQITDQDIETFRSYFNELDSDSVICLVYHFITDDGPETTSTPVSNFREQMAYLKEAGFNVVLVSDLFK